MLPSPLFLDESLFVNLFSGALFSDCIGNLNCEFFWQQLTSEAYTHLRIQLQNPFSYAKGTKCV